MGTAHRQVVSHRQVADYRQVIPETPLEVLVLPEVVVVEVAMAMTAELMTLRRRKRVRRRSERLMVKGLNRKTRNMTKR